MSRSKKYTLEKKIMIFLSSGLFAITGFCAGDVQAAAVFADGTGTDSTVAGVGNDASGDNATAVGYKNTATASAVSASAFGNSNEVSNEYANAFGVYNKASDNYASAFGARNNATGSSASAFGYSNTASGSSASAFGYQNQALDYSSNAMGNMNIASGGYANAMGYGNMASGYGSNAVGSSNTASNNHTVAFGKNNTANASSAAAFGSQNQALNETATAFGVNNKASGYGSTAFGVDNQATDRFNSAFGYSNNASGYISTAIGYDNEATGVYTTAVGLLNTASAKSANAFGYGNLASGIESNAFGVGNKAQAQGSSAVGNNNTISSSATDSVALGNDIEITLENSVSLGSNSVATAINSVTGNSNYTKWAGVNDVVGVVSVGKAGATRQIQNVAAGEVSATSTDAVNGSQLYAVQQQLAGQQSTVVAGDNNVVVTPTTNSSGGTEYEVKLADDLTIGTEVTIEGTGDGKIDVGNGKVVIDGNDSSVTAGGVTINKDDEGTINGLTNTTWDPDNYVSGQAATEDQLKAIHDKAAEAVEQAARHTTISTGDNNIVLATTTNAAGGDHHELKLNDVVEIGSGANKVTVDGNNGTISTGNVNINGTNGKITADNITIDGGAGKIGGLTNTTWDANNHVSGQAATEDQLKVVHDSAVKYDVDSGGNINKNKITLEGSNGTTIGNVAAGEVSATSMDAVNGSQLHQVKQDISSINHDITKLGDEIDTVGALSAAMAGLHPRFQDGNKGELAMAYGGYGGKSALAVGGFYAPNEKVMFSLGLGMSEGGSKMGNFGVNFALDRSNNRKAEPRDILYTRKEVDQSLAEQDAKIKLLLAKLEEHSQEMEKQRREIEYLRAQVKN